MFSNSIDTYKIKCKIIDSTRISQGCAIARLDEADGDVRVSCAQAADELLGVQGIKASFVIFPYKDSISVSARSLGEVNVQVIMEKLGGGGHQTMAAAQISDCSAQDVENKLLEVLKETLEENKKVKEGTK